MYICFDKTGWQQCKITLRRLNHILFGLIFLLLVNSCEFKRNEREINFDQSIELANLMAKYSIQELSISRDSLIRINNLIIVPDSIDQQGIETIHRDSLVTMSYWIRSTGFTNIDLSDLKHLLTESNNFKIVMENGAFFFMTGSWIDAHWGKVYSKTDITDQEDLFKFDRVKEIEPIKNQPNWFDYYAD